jgi:transcription elongation factor SPT4
LIQICSLSDILHQEFFNSGCPNCEAILLLRQNEDAILESTSQVFEGLIALNDPKTSWVAKWQRLTEYVPGTYAVKVSGTLDPEVIGSLEDNGIKYVPRDGSGMEEDSIAA